MGSNQTCFICGTHYGLDGSMVVEDKIVPLCHFCSNKNYVKNTKPLCWRCKSYHAEGAGGLCSHCKDSLDVVRRFFLVISAILLFVAGAIIFSVTQHPYLFTAWLFSCMIGSVLYLLYVEGWFGWIPFLIKSVKDEDNHRGEPRDS